MPNTSKNQSHPLKKALGFRDLTLMNISLVVGFSGLTLVAQFGYSSIIMYMLVMVLLFIPSGLIIAELNTKLPGEGGFYNWVGTAFGDVHGFLVAWSYWLSSIVWFPTVMLFISTSAVYLLGSEYLFLTESKWYNIIFGLLIIWGVTGLNIVGLEKAKWIQNIGGVANWVSITLLFILGVWYVTAFESAQIFSWEALVPDFTDLSILPFFAAVAYCFGGLELAPVMAGEIKDPANNIPKAIITSAVIIGAIYIVGSLMLILTLPAGEIDEINGLVQSFSKISEALNIEWLGWIGMILITLGTLGLFGSWLTGNARIPFVIGLDSYLPKSFGSIHPKFGTPHVSLFWQGVIVTILFLTSQAGSTITEAFLILYNMSILLYFLPFLYMFAAFIYFKHRDEHSDLVFFSFLSQRNKWVYIIGSSAFLTTLIACLLAIFPSGSITENGSYIAQVLGGAFLLNGLGLIIFFVQRSSKIQNN